MFKSAVWIGFSFLLAWHGATALAQSAVDRAWSEFVKPDKVLSREKGEEALRRSAEIAPKLAALSSEERAKALELAVHSHLLRGDAAGAKLAFDKFAEADATTSTASQTGYLVGVVAGDAVVALQALTAWEAEDGAKRKTLRAHEENLRLIGATIKDRSALAGGEPKLLVLDCWSPPEITARSTAALVRAIETHDRNAVRFVGVCLADKAAAATGPGAARQWTQFYADSDPASTVLLNAFPISRNVVLIIEADGVIRSAAWGGDDPAFHYALRAAVAESKGEFAPITPRGLREASEQNHDAAPTAGAGTGSAASGTVMRSDPEAARLLDQARLFVRTGRRTDARKLFQEIMDRFPNTTEAAEAAERIRGL